MKKIFLSVAILSTVVSCSKNDVADNATPNASQIGFSTLNDKVSSRAANDASANYVVYSQFSTATAGWYIGGEVINGETDAIVNDAKTYYWPETKLDFYAYAPSSVNAVPTTPTVVDPPAKGTVSIVYTVNNDANEDFTVAEPVVGQLASTGNTGTGAGAGTGTAGTVAFTFSHMLSKVNITATLVETLTGDGYALTLGNAVLTVKKNSGTVEITATTPALVAGVDAASAPVYTASATDDVAVPYLIMPQTAVGCIVTIEDAVIEKSGYSDIPVTLTATLASSMTGLSDGFKPGYQYNLNFAVTLTEIKFSSSTVAWETVTIPLN